MSTVVLTMPVPPAQLSPNARMHWAKKAGIVKREKEAANFRAASCPDLSPGMKVASYRLHFFFNDKRRRDRDNFTGRCKAALDGISQYIGQDDSEWEFNGVRFERSEEPRLEVWLEISNES